MAYLVPLSNIIKEILTPILLGLMQRENISAIVYIENLQTCLFCLLFEMFLAGFHIRSALTICPRSPDPIYIVNYFFKWANTSWTDSNTYRMDAGRTPNIR